MVDGLAAAISKMTGVNSGIIKTVLGYLAPVVLGYLGSSFGGVKPTADGLKKLFSEQKSNISSAMPSGFSLDSIPGFQSLASTGSAVSSHSAPPQGSVASKIFSPLLLLGGLGSLIYYVIGQVPPPQATPEAPAIEAMAPAAPAVETPVIPKLDLSKIVPKLPVDMEGMKTKMTGMFDALSSKLSAATDAASADAMLPDLTGYADQLGTISASMKVIPAEGRSMISGLIKSQLDKLDPMFEKFTSIPGIGDSVKAVIEKIKTALLQIMG
jgi:hypothetical protein